MFSHFKEEGRVGKFSLNAQVAFEIFHLPKRISEREEWEILSEQVSEENKEKVFGVTQVKKAFTKFISPIDRTALKKKKLTCNGGMRHVFYVHFHTALQLQLRAICISEIT